MSEIQENVQKITKFCYRICFQMPLNLKNVFFLQTLCNSIPLDATRGEIERTRLEAIACSSGAESIACRSCLCRGLRILLLAYASICQHMLAYASIC